MKSGRRVERGFEHDRIVVAGVRGRGDGDDRSPAEQVLETVLVGAASVVFTLGATIVAGSFLYPVSDLPADAGPIVVLGGGSGERLDEALRVRADTDRLLVLSTGVDDEWRALGGSCEDAEVVCLDPEPVDTRSEAGAIADLTAQRGWSQVTVVTSRFHVPRSRSLFTRCVPADVRVVGAARPGDPLRVPVGLAVREALATGVSAVIHRSC